MPNVVAEVDITHELEAVKDTSLELERLLLAGDSRWQQTAYRLIDACIAVAHAVEPTVASATPALGDRIADLVARGVGVRQIARQLGVNPSTVSRRLRNARAKA
jgi:hypothetical protein